MDAAFALDRAVTGYDRSRFLRGWITGNDTRHTRVLVREGEIAALGVIRACVSGYKIGPLFAEGRAAAEDMLDGLGRIAAGARVSLDVPEPNGAAMAMADALGLTADFETARMWRGPAPEQDLGRTFGVATFELG